MVGLQSRDRVVWRWTVLAIWAAAVCGLTESASAQKLYQERSAFDVVVLKRDGSRHKILPLPGRSAEVKTSGTLKVRLMADPADEKVISWSEIQRIDLFETMLLAQASEFVRDKEFDDAFKSYDRLLNEYPRTPGLDPAVQAFLYINAEAMIAAGQLTLAMSTLEELYDRNPGFQRGGGSVFSLLSTVSSKMLDDLIEKNEDYPSARRLIVRLDLKYGSGERRLPATLKWRGFLIDLARTKMVELRQLLDQKKYLPARDVSAEMMTIWPELEGALKLAEETVRLYPIALIGVMQRVNTPDPLKIDDWAARRAGRLTERSLVEFVSPSPEGGYYSCPFGSVEKSDDYRHLYFQLRANSSGLRLTSYELGDWLLAMADPRGPHYRPRWAALVDGVEVEDDSRVRVDLRKPDVLPEARLRVLISSYPPLAAHVDSMRPYNIKENTEQHVRFVRNPAAISQGVNPPAELYERFYANFDRALNDLRYGRIDILDRLFPADTARLLEDATADIVVRPYALPTVHFLAINKEHHAFLKNNAFRQALIRTIPRELILDRLLNGRKLSGCRVISAPIPAGRSMNDTLAYAYNEKIKTRRYDNGIGIIMMSIARGQFDEIAERKKEEPPELVPLILAHPEDKIARFACRIIAEQFKLIGVECNLKQLGKGMTNDPKRDYDLLYVAATVSEPVVDIERLVGRTGIGQTDDQYVNYYVRRIAESTSWRDIRGHFENLHQTIFSDVTVIPLWQLTEYYAHRPGLYGLDDNVVNLYQNIDNWVLSPTLEQE
jgi:ABC-type transport system substrate-binding protein